MRTIYVNEVIAIMRDILDVHFTGHSISVRKRDSNSVVVFWEDGPTTDQVGGVLGVFSRVTQSRVPAYLFPDGSLSGREFSEGYMGCEEVYIRISYIEYVRSVSDAFLSRFKEGFEKEEGLTVVLRTDSQSWGWNKNYLMYNPVSFVTNQGKVVEQWGDFRQEYELYRARWSILLRDHGDYDSEKAAINFLIPLSVV